MTKKKRLGTNKCSPGFGKTNGVHLFHNSVCAGFFFSFSLCFHKKKCIFFFPVTVGFWGRGGRVGQTIKISAFYFKKRQIKKEKKRAFEKDECCDVQ